mmetsp:Transcript_11288/g.20300  ORF Transcript_11288/g.20300 Transcript_11288/m.20300 type:complete len:297 (-) Transcript_11288:454-1344(-)|eukprot:CAMPEP_0201652846 /NCGR_PEP_ID=MMETSP0493-20130528/44684_1 /ASSEMBLY_ACC=CAM_ASM_000838 /TAXON_ID=420259 /ORGANISM="Thalassiosira gravida, Strain GMp14c1" /LENGTH=296 /DNA_ID=CAMNT_0048129371 /DNA_START=176 /DNA_END=1066 /DNA_ORIENTATION=+
MSDDEESNAPPSGAVHQIVPRLQSGPAQTTTSELAAGLSRWMDASNNFIYVELASLVLLFACVADWYPTVWHKYALSVACVSLLVCLILQTAEFLVPGFLQWSAVKQGDDGTGGHSIQKVCSVFMLLWWIFGAGIITFHAPFVVTSNGWFGAWGGLLATVKWCIGLKFSVYEDQPAGLKQLYYIFTCSIILLLASIPPLVQKWEHYGGAGFSIAGSALTIIACAYMVTMYSDIPKSVLKINVVLLFVLWSLVAGVCTFHGPFLITNNGFFACWLGCLCSLNLMVIEMKDASPENYT